MYLNQKEFVFNVKDLSLLLIIDANERFAENKQNISNFDNNKSYLEN
tara:strand:+ start:971 stop:1111 length:141 start_codon:yes stop_codon:yes gene_type:complete